MNSKMLPWVLFWTLSWIVGCGQNNNQLSPSPVPDETVPDEEITIPGNLLLGDGGLDLAGNLLVDGGAALSGSDAGFDLRMLPLAANITIREVAFFQTVKVSVAAQGVHVTNRNGPIVAERAGMMRVYVDPGAGYVPGSITADLVVTQGTSLITTIRDTKTITGSSTEDDLTSTFNFQVPSAIMTSEAYFAVALLTSNPVPTTPANTAALYPPDGKLERLGVQSGKTVVKVVIVPVQYNADKSGRLPDTGAAMLQHYSNRLLETYPTSTVDVSVRSAPYAWNGTISASGDGFDAILEAMVGLRQSDDAPADVYYYGVFNPADSFDDYCPDGCVTGLSGVIENPADAVGRASVGVGFSEVATWTMVHELAHLHGRMHAPCETTGVDPYYPYDGGSVGSTWGWNQLAGKLIPPADSDGNPTHDFMGYCSERWTSDYTYRALSDRIVAVNNLPPVPLQDAATGAAADYVFVRLAKDDSLTWGQTITLKQPPASPPRVAHYRSELGSVLKEVTAYPYRYADNQKNLGHQFFLVPVGPADYHDLHIAGSTPARKHVIRHKNHLRP